jgi:hypothetical protein
MVYISADRLGDLYQVDRCDIAQPHRRPIGMVISKASATDCLVQTFGEISSIYTGLTPGRHLFLGLDLGARLTHVFPGPAITHKLYTQLAGYSLAADRLFLQLQEPIVLVP